MNITFNEVTLNDLMIVKDIRNANLQNLRTPHLLTRKMQEDFFDNVINNRHHNSRYWSVYQKEQVQIVGGVTMDKDVCIGMVGINNIQWENRLGEISFMIDAENNIYKFVFNILLNYAFNVLNLDNIFAEVYECHNKYELWEDIGVDYNAYMTILPERKYNNGLFYDSTFMKFSKKYIKEENDE